MTEQLLQRYAELVVNVAVAVGPGSTLSVLPPAGYLWRASFDSVGTCRGAGLVWTFHRATSRATDRSAVQPP